MHSMRSIVQTAFRGSHRLNLPDRCASDSTPMGCQCTARMKKGREAFTANLPFLNSTTPLAGLFSREKKFNC
ncbi:hypothetical cytosolic protein [Syntrophus aciditrophicus SB]|uniref:Hypothetical cytosolic protein n=1 Tax=Syntrophus aciditrophicus (strain SB) TaxID=56780 RepID=Q2LQG4_SYNAS|nr:hypothetical cytosolic protein [Syntrophus aciditrophicus SB]